VPLFHGDVESLLIVVIFVIFVVAAVVRHGDVYQSHVSGQSETKHYGE